MRMIHIYRSKGRNHCLTFQMKYDHACQSQQGLNKIYRCSCVSNQLKATGNCSLLNYFVLAVIRSGTQLNSLASYRYMKVNDNFPLSFRKWNIEMNI